MPLDMTTDVTSLLFAPTHAPIEVTYIGFDSIRERCRELGLGAGTRLVVRGRADSYLLVERASGDLVTVDPWTARFVQVADAAGREPRAA